MPRFSPTKYKPSDDSSPGHRTVDPRHVVLFVNEQTGDGARLGCPCGCGEFPRGKNATFQMGHDARYRGILIRAHLSGTGIVRIVGRQRFVPETAMELAKLEGKSFVDALKNAELRREGKNREVLRNALGSARLIKVGRWAYTGQVVAVYSTLDEEFYDIEYVTKLGERKVLKRVPASEAPEQETMA